MNITRSHSVSQGPYHLTLIPRNVSDDSLTTADLHSPSSSSGRLAASNSSHGSATTTRHSRNVLFSVLCIHDYDAAATINENGFPFRKNEILQVIEQQSSGWWAARRKGTKEIGWIPKAFVVPLTPEMADRYEKMREEIRCCEHNAEQLYLKAPTSAKFTSLTDSDIYSTPSNTLSRTGSLEGSKPSTPSYNKLGRSKSRGALAGNPKLVVTVVRQRSQSPPRIRKQPQPPPSPSSPVPAPPLSASTTNGQLLDASQTRNARDVDKYAISDLTSPMHALSKRARSEQAQRAEIRQNHAAPKKSFHLLENPLYIIPAHAEELELDNEGQVRTGSQLALVERLASKDAFPDPRHPNASRPSFANIFLMTLRTFTTSDQLFDQLLDRFSMTRPDGLNEIEVEDWKNRCLYPTQRHVLAVFTLWLEEHRLLEDDPHIAQRLPDFVTHVAMRRHLPESQALMQTIERLTFADPVLPPMGLTPRKPRKFKSHKNDLLRLDPVEIAEQLTLYEYNRYSRITPRECLAYIHTQTGHSVANLAGFIRTYDQLAGWVKLSVLNASSIIKRASTIDLWIKVAEKCRSINNFVSTSAIVSALCSAAITRLSLTWTHVGKKSSLDALEKLNDPSGSFAAYRGLLSNVEPTSPCVPFITMYLTDIVRIKEHYSDSPGRICFLQRQRWYEAVSALLKFQRRPYSVVFDEQVSSFVNSHLGDGDTRDGQWYWNRSQEVLRTECAHADVRKGLQDTGF